MKGSPIMAHIADPVMLAPTSTSEACLRIQDSMKGAKAEGRLVTHKVADRVTNIVFDAGRGPALLSYEFHSVDVTDFYEQIQKNHDGTLKRPHTGGGEYADPVLYDTYCHEDEPGDEALFTLPSSGNPHFGRTRPRPADFDHQLVEQLQLSEPEPATEEREPFSDSTAKVALAASRKRGYEPMKSGVWVDVGVNEDDVVAAHPDAKLDEVYGERKVISPGTEAKIDRLIEHLGDLMELLQKKQTL
jgi:hypothetical protein